MYDLHDSSDNVEEYSVTMTGPLPYRLECSPKAQETSVQSQVDSDQRFKNGNWCPLLNTQHYKVRIKSKVEQSREWSSALLNTSV